MLLNLSQLALWEGDATLALAHARSALNIVIAVQDQVKEAHALHSIGYAELALGRHEAAAATFARAHAQSLTRDDRCKYDAAAGLARVALAQGDLAGAMLAVEEVLAHLAGGGTLEGADAPHSIRLCCYEVLQRANDPRAAEMLASAHTYLQAQADNVSNTTFRHSFLTNVPVHREIVAIWAARRFDLPS